MSSTGKEPMAFNTAEVVAILNGASTATGEDFPRAFRVMKEIKGLPEYTKTDKGETLAIKDEIFLHLKPSDPRFIWKWIKAFYVGDGKRLTPVALDGLAGISGKLGQSDDYAAVVEDMTTEEDDKPAEVAEATNAGTA